MSLVESVSIAESLLAEFEQEAKTTRKFLEQLPEAYLQEVVQETFESS